MIRIGLAALLLVGGTPAVAPAASENPLIETVSIETGLDTDRDGVLDRVWADIIRPRTAAKVPVVLEASPYHEGFEGSQADPGAGPAFTMEIRSHLAASRMVPRGYAFMRVQVPGTGRSTGCTDVGGPGDIGSMAEVISWLTGHGQAWTRGGEAVTASWSSGSVGMIGHSYDGSLAIGLAAAGVPGLKAIVPTSAISQWYGWSRTNGLVKSGRFDAMSAMAALVAGPDARARCQWKRDEIRAAEDSASGDMNEFWRDRDYLRDTGRFTAAVLTRTGQRDVIVPITQFTPLWEKLGARGVPRRAWITQADHEYVPGNGRYGDWFDLTDRWMDRWLRGEKNGVDREPAVDVQDVGEQNWVQQACWPRSSRVRFFTGHPAAGRAPFQTAPVSGTYEVVPATGPQQFFLVAGQDKPVRLFAAGPVLAEDTRISGIPAVTATVTPTTSSTPLSAYLVYFSDGDEYMRSLSTGVIDLKNRESLDTAVPLVPGQPATARWELGAVDQVVPAGRRLGLVLVGNNYMGTQDDPAAGPFSVNLAGTSISVPMAR